MNLLSNRLKDGMNYLVEPLIHRDQAHMNYPIPYTITIRMRGITMYL